MSIWSRITNAFTDDRLNRELNEEYENHIAEAIASGRDPEEARRAFGSLLRHRESSRQHRVAGWVESLRMDLVFGLRQLKRNKVTSAAAILSLGLAMGACVGAFRLVDALLWRPLPIAHPERLYLLERHGAAYDGSYQELNDWNYPDFAQMRDAVQDEADLLAVSFAGRADVTYGSDQDMEKAAVQYVSSSLFRVFGLHPAAGRVLIDEDDRVNGGQPFVVLSYDYWTRRFGRDPKAIGSSVRVGSRLCQIVGVAERSFTGTEPGTITEIFLPAALNEYAKDPNSSWMAIFAAVHPGAAIGPLTRQLETLHRAFATEQEKGNTGMQKELIKLVIRQQVVLEPAFAGSSGLQAHYRRALGALGILVALVLLIACVNVANLMTAQAAARMQEMALRVSIGAGRLRLVQLVLAESALLAAGSALVGAFFAWWSAPFVVSRISSFDNPVRLVLPADWRVAFFALGLIVAVMLLFGLLPALRASSVRPVSALKGGDDPHARKRLMYGMVAAQVAFCALVVFFAGLFVTTFERLSKQPLGFNPENLALLDVDSPQLQPAQVWEQTRLSLQQLPGVQQTAMTNIELLSGVAWIGYISARGVQSSTLAYFCGISPDWRETMKIRLLRGRDILPSDASPNVAVVNETFARTYFPGIDPIGKWFTRRDDRMQIVGLMQDAPYNSLRNRALPVAFVPFRHLGKDGRETPTGAIFLVRLRPDLPLPAMKTILRQAVAKSHVGFRISDLRTQQELLDAQTNREHVLAMLALFFAAVALLLAGIGLFGVLQYTVLQRRREIGIRIAVGARRAGIAGLVARPIFSMIVLGAAIGLTAGIFAAHSIETLFYATKATDAGILTLPAAAILSVAVLAVIPAIRRAVRTDPAEILRAE
ncbi:MAG TPA: ABC transporter permease [Acidobacteriaceae bacterium]